MVFQITLIAVSVLLATAIPGYIALKKKIVGEECIVGLSKIMLFICQPCLAVYTFKSCEYSVEVLKNIGIFAIFAFAILVVMLGGGYLVLRKHCEKKPVFRIMTISTAFSNAAFFGIPVMEAIVPSVASEMLVYTTVFAVVMNIAGWTVGAAIIANDRKYMKPEKIILNPATIGLIVALLIFVLKVPIQKDFYSMIVIIGKMCSPLSMLIMGMRLATMNVPSLFKDYRIYLIVAVKQLFMPLLAFASVYFLPLPYEFKTAFLIICACPVASVVLNFAEIVGEGQKEAANTVLLSTTLSIVTMPLIMLLLPLLS